MTLIAIFLGLLTAGLIYETLSASADNRNFPPPGRLVDVDGIRLHLNCTGSGGPVVVLASGLGDSSLVWSFVQTRLSLAHRVCSYDRPGIAWSEAGTAASSAQSAVDQLRNLLLSAGERPPYVLVGHSSGANYARLFAFTYPEDVKALVLIEPPILTDVPPIMVGALKMIRRGIGGLSRVGVIRLLGRLRLMRILFSGSSPPNELEVAAGFLYRPESIQASIREVEELPATIRQLNEASTPSTLNDLPLVIISAHSGPSAPARLLEALQSISRISRRGKIVSVPGSHFVHFDSPEIVVRTIEEVIGGSSD